MPRSRTAFTALALAVVTIAAGTAAAASSYPSTIPLPRGFQPEGIAIRANSFYVGSIPTGAVYRGDLRTGSGAVLVEGQSGRAAIGVAVDNRNRLFVAGGPTGKAFVYDARTGADVAEYTLAPGFINDVVVTRTGAYFTNSARAELYRIPIGNGGGLGSTVETIPLTGDFQQAAGFNANGIDATPNGRWLVIVQSNTGKLFRVDPSTGATKEIALGGESVPNGDGILLQGQTLFVVQNQLNRLAVIALSAGFTTGTVIQLVSNPNFDIPTTVAANDGSLFLVNARFGIANPDAAAYSVVRIAKP